MAKQIAVLMCAIKQDNQRKIMEGMIKACKETDCNLYVFTNYVDYSLREEHIQTAYQILKLPDLSSFDGIIVAENSLHFKIVKDNVMSVLRELGAPTVSIDVKEPGMSCVGVTSYTAQYAMVEHFIVQHDCDEVYYVAGPRLHPEAKVRYQAYCDALKRHGIEFSKERVYEGMFNEESGADAAKHFLKSGKCPRAIVCANDMMAAGVMDELVRQGYRIPEDVWVTGFDDGELAEMYNPPLTTVDKNQQEVGYQAVYEVLSLIDGGEPKEHNVSCKLKIRRSCGCNRGAASYEGKLKLRYVDHRAKTQMMSDVMRTMTTDFSEVEKPEELVETLKKYIPETGIENFYLCLGDRDRLFGLPEGVFGSTQENLHNDMGFTEQVTIPLAYEEGEFREYGAFPSGMVLPEECRNRRGGNYYIVVPVFYRRCVYGYCVSGNSYLPLDHSLYYSWVMSIGTGFENIRKWMLLNDTVEKLNGMWVYDTLTNIYNRAGFYYYAKPMIEKMQEQRNIEEAFLLFIDIDGLKQVNDNLGHEAGDELIRGMAEAIKLNVRDNQLAMRYGGDEFVVFGACEEGALDKLMNGIRATMNWRNQKKGNKFVLQASMGASTYRVSEITSLDKLIEQADEKMYEEKKRKRLEKKLQETN